MNKPLTAKQQAALDYYLLDPSVTQVEAYKHAYKHANLTENSIKKAASKLFNSPEMVEALNAAKAKGAEQAGVNAAYVLAKAKLLVDFNIRKFMRLDTVSGQMVYDLSLATDDDWWCVDELAGLGKPLDDRPFIYPLSALRIKSTAKATALKIFGDHVDIKAYTREQDQQASDASLIADALRELAQSLPL